MKIKESLMTVEKGVAQPVVTDERIFILRIPVNEEKRYAMNRRYSVLIGDKKISGMGAAN